MTNAISWSVGADNSPFRAVMRQTEGAAKRSALNVTRNLDGMKKGFGNVARWAAGTAAAIGLIAAARAGIGNLKKTFDDGGTLSDLAAQTGITAGQLAILRQAFLNNGLAADKLAPTINKMQRAIVEGRQGVVTYRRAFGELGLDLEALERMRPEEQFAAIQEKISAIENPTRRAAVAMQIFGRSGGQLLTLFADGAALQTARREVGGLAAVMDANAGKFDAISDKLAATGLKSQQFFAGVAERLADPILALLERFAAVDLATKGKEAGTAILGFINSALEGWAQLQRGVLIFQGSVAQIAGVTSEIVNVAWDGIQRVTSLADTFMAAMAEGIAALSLDAQTGFQFAFQHVARFFDTHMGAVIDNIAAALEFAIQKSIEGISKIPILGKQLGLEGFQAESFGAVKDRAAGNRAARQSTTMRSYADMRSENFRNSAGLQGLMDFATAARNVAGAARTPAVDPATIQGFYAEASSLAAAAGNVTAGKVSMTPTPQAQMTDAQIRAQSGVSERYFSQLVGMYGNSQVAMDLLRQGGVIRAGQAAGSAAATATKAETETLKAMDDQTKKLGDILGVMEEAWK